MKKIITWAKRPANMNFMAFITIALVLAVLAVDWNNKISILEEKMNELGEWMEETRENGVDDVEGYGLIFGGAGYAFGVLGDMLLTVLMVYIPAILAISAFIQAVFLRLIYKAGDNGRTLCYRIFMGISCFFTVGFTFLYAVFVLFQIGTMIGTATLISLITLAALIICIRNTYSKRIHDKEKLCIS